MDISWVSSRYRKHMFLCLVSLHDQNVPNYFICIFTGVDPGFCQEGVEIAFEAQSCQCSEVEPFEQIMPYAALEWTLETLGFLMLKYAFTHIIETHFLHLWHIIKHQKLKNKAVHCTPIKLEYLHIIYTLCKFVLVLYSSKSRSYALQIRNLGRYAEWNEARTFFHLSVEK